MSPHLTGLKGDFLCESILIKLVFFSTDSLRRQSPRVELSQKSNPCVIQLKGEPVVLVYIIEPSEIDVLSVQCPEMLIAGLSNMFIEQYHLVEEFLNILITCGEITY